MAKATLSRGIVSQRLKVPACGGQAAPLTEVRGFPSRKSLTWVQTLREQAPALVRGSGLEAAGKACSRKNGL